jgi:signal transduction histidine kinase
VDVPFFRPPSEITHAANRSQWGVYPIYIPGFRTDIDLNQMPAEEVGVLNLRTHALGSAIRMKHKLNKVSRRYVAALRNHLKKGVKKISRPALPIVQTHQTDRQRKTEVLHLNKMLDRRTAELAESNRLLQLGIVRHKTMEATLKKNAQHYVELLKDSVQLQDSLRQLARKGLSAQEAERKKISHELQDDVAQLLLSINVRLLTLRRGAKGSSKSLKNQIASTQRLVSQSVKSVRHVVTELDSHRYV